MSQEITPALRDVINALLSGHTVRKEIGRSLNIAPRTVSERLRKIHRKTDTTNMADIVLWAWRNGWELGGNT